MYSLPTTISSKTTKSKSSYWKKQPSGCIRNGSWICGSLGMLPSASLCQGAQDNGLFFGLYEPSGGSAPDIAGKGIANPIAQILSLSMLLRYSLGEKAAADAIDAAVRRVIDQGFRTGDLATGAPGEIRVNTAEMGDAIIAAL